MRLVARAWPNMTYICGWDRMKPLVESHIASIQVEDIESGFIIGSCLSCDQHLLLSRNHG